MIPMCSIYSDRTIGQIMYKLSNSELHLLVIKSMTDSSIQNNATYVFTLPIVEQGHLRRKNNSTLVEIVKLLEEQVNTIEQQLQQRYPSASIVEITDDETECTSQEQAEEHKLLRRQRRSDLNAPLEQETDILCTSTIITSTSTSKSSPQSRKKYKTSLSRSYTYNCSEESNTQLLHKTHSTSSSVISPAQLSTCDNSRIIIVEESSTSQQTSSTIPSIPETIVHSTPNVNVDVLAVDQVVTHKEPKHHRSL